MVPKRRETVTRMPNSIHLPNPTSGINKNTPHCQVPSCQTCQRNICHFFSAASLGSFRVCLPPLPSLLLLPLFLWRHNCLQVVHRELLSSLTAHCKFNRTKDVHRSTAGKQKRESHIGALGFGGKQSVCKGTSSSTWGQIQEITGF